MCVCARAYVWVRKSVRHHAFTMSHHHTYYVTSSHILCHIIIHRNAKECEYRQKVINGHNTRSSAAHRHVHEPALFSMSIRVPLGFRVRVQGFRVRVRGCLGVCACAQTYYACIHAYLQTCKHIGHMHTHTYTHTHTHTCSISKYVYTM